MSATNSGLVTLPSSIGIVAGSIITGQVMARTGTYKPIAIIAGVGVVCALFLLSQMTVDTSLWETRAFMFLMGISMGSLMPLYTLVLQNSLPFKLLGAGTAANQFFRQIGAAGGVAVFGALIATNFAAQLGSRLGSGVPAELREDPAWLLNADALERLRGEMGAAAEPLIETAQVALAGPVTDTFFYAAAIMVASVIIAILLPKVRFRTQEDMMAEARAAMGARAGQGAGQGAGPDMGLGMRPDGRAPSPVPAPPSLADRQHEPIERPMRPAAGAIVEPRMRAIALWANQAMPGSDWASS